jgi:hypothetical protein
LLLPAILVVAPSQALADPVVGTKFSIASGWAGITAASDGTNFLVAFESDTVAAKVAAQLISSSGAKIGSTIALGHDGQSCCAVGAAFDGTNYLVAWEEDQGIKNREYPFLVYGQFIAASGAKVGQAFAISTAGIYFDGLKTLAYGAGKYLVTYTRLIDPTKGDASTNRYVAGRIVSPDGSMGSEFRISQGFGSGSSVTSNGEDFFVVWTEDSQDYEVRGRFVSPSGNLGQEISINASLAPSDMPVAVAFDGTNYLVAWNDEVGGRGTDEWDISGQRVSPSGALVGNLISIVSAAGQQVIPTLDFDGANYLAVWIDAKNDANHNNTCDAGEGTCWDVYGQYISKDGALVGSKLAINVDAGNQFGGVGCVSGKCLALISSSIVLGSGGPSQVGELYGAFVSLSTTTQVSAVTVSCPSSINSGTSGTCTTKASYVDGTSKTVTATLSSGNATALNVSASSLIAGSVTTDTVVTITATYVENGVANTATASVTVKAPIITSGGTVTPITKPEDLVSNPNSSVSVDSSGALVVSTPTAPIVLSPTAPENAMVKLATLQPVSFTSGITTLQYTDQVGAAQLLIRTVNNQPQLEVAKGTVEISAPASNITISVVSSNQKTVGSIVTLTSADTVVVEKTDTTSAVFVDAGKVDYKGPGQSITVYQGENTQLGTSGTLNQLALGSLGGKKQVPGDPLPVTTTPKDTATKVPNLDGNLPRFSNTVTLQDIVKDMIKDLVKDTTGVGKLSYDKSTGVITYVVGTTTYRLIALGDVLVQLNQFAATNAAATAGGAYTLAARGIQMSLSGALGYFSDLQKLLTAADAKGTLSLKPTGAIELRAGAGHYVVMPGSSASLPNNPNPLPGFEADASGYAVFRDHLGTLQTLYPAFLDVDTLNSTFKLAAPTIVMANKPDGTVTAVLAGQNYTIRPEYVVVDQPVGHAAEAYWVDSGMIYLRNADRSAQGMKVQ